MDTQAQGGAVAPISIKRSRSTSPVIELAKRVRQATSDSDDASLFYIDVDPVYLAPNVSAASNLYEYLATSDAIIAVLGDDTPHLAIPTKNDARTCFNCLGDHILSACPFRRDRDAIAANREAFNASHGANRGRLSDRDGDDEQRMRSLALVDKFRPGEISFALRQALGYGDAPDGVSPEYPFYWAMRDWGYPPGWVSSGDVVHDPLESIRESIKRDQDWEQADLLQVHGSAADDPTFKVTFAESAAPSSKPSSASSPLPPRPSGTPPPPPPDTAPPPLPPRRIVQFPTTLFDSFVLPVHRPDQHFPLSRPQPFFNHLRMYQAQRAVTEHSSSRFNAVCGEADTAVALEAAEAVDEQDMDLGDTSDEDE